LLRELNRTGAIDFVAFYGRRARRLLPAALLVTAATLVAGYFVLSPLEQKEIAKSAAASSLFATNLLLLSQALNYFGPESSLNPFLHTWSLSVEEQFYFVWPILLLVLSRAKGRALPSGLVFITSLSFVLCIYLTYRKQAWAFYLSPARAWEFGVGALASLFPFAKWATYSRSAAVSGWIALAALILSCFLLDEFSAFPGYLAAAPVVATAVVLTTGKNGAGPNLLLKQRAFQFAGTRSYAMYLWHWPILVLGSTMFGTTAATTFAYFILTVMLSAVSFVWLEHPIRSNSWLVQSSIRSVAVGSVLTIVGLLAGAGLFLEAKFVNRPRQMAIQASTSKYSISTENGCLVAFTTAKPARCVFGPSNYTRTIVLFGDSHADQWTTALARIAERKQWRLITYLKSSCSASDIAVYNMRLRRFSPECEAWRRETIDQIVADRPDLIIVSQFSSGYIKGDLTNLGPNAVEQDAWEAGLRQTFLSLQAAHSAILLLRDNPTPYLPVGICLARAEWRGLSMDECGRDREVAVINTVTKSEQRVASQFANTRFVDLTPEICSGSRCPATRDGTIVYRDANHLTVDFTLRLEPTLAREIQSALKET